MYKPYPVVRKDPFKAGRARATLPPMQQRLMPVTQHELSATKWVQSTGMAAVTYTINSLTTERPSHIATEDS